MATFEEVEVGEPTTGQFLYRFEDTMEPGSFFGRINPEMDSEPFFLEVANVGVALRRCFIEKETPKGWWVRKVMFDNYTKDDKHFVLKKARKRYAYPTIPEAMESYRRRKEKQIRILARQLAQTKRRLKIIEGA